MTRTIWKSLVLPAVATFALLLAGCGDDDGGTTTPPTPVFFPSTLGSYWIYQHQDIDSSGQIVGQTTVDSVVIAAIAQNIYGRNAQSAISYNLGGGPTDTLVLSISDSTVYALLDFRDVDSTVPRWVKIIDANQQSWITLDTTLPRMVQGITANVNIHVEGNNGGQETVTPPAGTYNATRYMLVSTISTTVSTPLGPISLAQRDTTVYHHMRGVGFVVIRDNPAKSTSSNPLIPLPNDSGKVQTLLRFKIN